MVTTNSANSFFECYPKYGGRLNSLVLQNKDITANLLKSFAEPDEVRRDKAYTNTLLFPFPNRLRDGKYEHNGREYQFPINDEANGNALHGFLSDEELEIANSQPLPGRPDCYTSLILKRSFDNHKPYYPYQIDLEIRYEINGPSNFDLSMKATNKGDKSAPVAMGWHPYFDFGHSVDSLHLTLPKSNLIHVDERMIPDGSTTGFDTYSGNGAALGDAGFDNCFRLSGRAPHVSTIYSSSNGYGLRLTQDDNLPYLQLYTTSDRKLIAAEPVSANINAFQNGEGLTILQPQASFEINLRVSLF